MGCSISSMKQIRKISLILLMIFPIRIYGRPPDTLPNIIFILTDDQRWDALGYAGNEIIQTPQMDLLAREGTWFSHAIVTTPICSASRASIFTGVHERRHRYTFQTGPISDRFMLYSYPRLLKDAGYCTAFFGKFGVNYAKKEQLFDFIEDYDRNGQYDDYRGYYYKTLGEDTVHLTRYTGQKALDFIEEARADRPFCLSLSFSAPHAHDPAEEQYFWQDETDHLYQHMEMPGPELAEDEYFEQLPRPVREGFNRTRWYWRYDTPEKYQHSVKGYYRMIGGIDLEIAKIREKLKDKGLEKNTVIILMGDNGYYLGERQLAGKWLMHDNSIRVPLIIYDPRLTGHRTIDEMALNIDVPATIVELAGLKQPPAWHGKSLYPLVAGKIKSIHRDTVLIEHLWEFENIPPSEGVRTPTWKYFRYINDQSMEELYNLEKDPREINNLAGMDDHQTLLASLRQKCNELSMAFGNPDGGIPNGMRVEYLRDPDRTPIQDPLPEYSWVVPAEAVFQKAYQVLVASSIELLGKNIGDVWDSKQVRSNQSINVEHGGSSLKPGTSYFWKVRIWDQDNRLTEYSDAQTFRTGLFKESVSTANFFQVEKIQPFLFNELAPGSYFIDFGKDAFGTLELTYKTRQPDTLIIRFGEKLLEGKIDHDPGGSIRSQEIKMPVGPEMSNYIINLPADQRNTNQKAVQLPDSFGVITPFRYCEIDHATEGLTADDVWQKAYFQYFDYEQSQFSSADTVLNQVWDICKYSMKATSFTGFYIDGDRERIPYEGDALINQLGHFCTDSEYSMAKQTIEYFMTHPTWPTEWLLHTAMLIYHDYYYTGDLELLEAYYELLKHKTLMDLAREDGLISSYTEKANGLFMQNLGFKDTTARLKDIVDWPPAQKDTGWKLATPEGERDGHQMLPVNTVVNSFFYSNMVIMAEFAGLLNKPADKEHFEFMAAKVKKTMNEKLFDREKGIYIDGEGATHSSLHSNMMALAFGLVPDQYIKPVVDFIKSRGMACSVYGSQYLLEGLYKAGEATYAFGLMTALHDRSWWHMIESGTTITTEAWDMKYKPNGDWNHAWGAAPANIIPRYLWGIRPKTAGFGVVGIQPQLADLKHSSITYPTIRGSITGKYQRINDRYKKYSIELPANMVGEMILDEAGESVVTINGIQSVPEFGSIRLYPGINKVEVQINSF
jgi:alpha-L-rhamnosidase